MKTMVFNNDVLEFDRTAGCDWCGKRKLVGVTHYGTQQYYNRLVCEDCAKAIKAADEARGYTHELIEKEDK